MEPMRIEIPTPPFQPPDEESQDDSITSEEDARSVIGVSISRAQTRLISPQTPKAEREAALEHGIFDGIYDGIEQAGRNDDSDTSSQEGQIHQSQPAQVSQRQTEDINHSMSKTQLPSPWAATPKMFERPATPNQAHHTSRSRASTGPTSMLESLNIRRFMSNFHSLPFPKSSSLKDLSSINISAIFNGNKDTSSPQNVSSRRRAYTQFSPLSDRTAPSQLHKAPLKSKEKGGDHSPQGASPRRATSDQSLMLRKVTSPGSTLGDDSRWEHVQEQVNSRFKAIVDSFQDSSIKLPSLPSMPNINLNSLRPDFIKNRAWSDSKQPARAYVDASNGIGNLLKHGGDENAAPDRDQNVGRMSPKALSFLDQALEELTGDLVIMGGYRGSILRSAKPPHRQLWVPVKVGLNMRKVNLEVGLLPEDEENMEQDIFASGMLTHIGPVDMGRRLIKRLKSCGNVQRGKLRIHDYGYDWRLSPHVSSRKLVEFLETLPSNANGISKHQRGATIIAHSLGGLITRHAVNHRPELFAGIVYAGVPQHCVNILGPLRKGDEVLLSSRVLTAQVNFTLRTSFLLLPEDGKCFINKHTKEEYPVDFFNVDDWREHAFSPCIAPTLPSTKPPQKKGLLGSVSGSLPSLPLQAKRPSLPHVSSKESSPPPSESTQEIETNHTSLDKNNNNNIIHPPTRAVDPHLDLPPPSSSISTHCTLPFPAALAYLTRTLASTLTFKRELAFRSIHSTENRYPPLSILYSTSTPTVLAARVSSRDAIRRADAYDDLAFGSGDGVCLAKAAMLPEGYCYVKGGRVRTERGHVGLLGDLEAVGKCLVAVREARKRGVGLGR